MKNIIAAAAVIAATLLSSSAEAMPDCRRTTTCESALQDCLEFRTRRKVSPSVLTCEASTAVCRSTGVWRGKFMRGTPEVNECKIAGR